jgi:hypothetical protein
MNAMPKAVREYLVAQGKKWGKIGGKKSMAALTPEQRSELGRKAVRARKHRPVLPENR